MSQDRFAFGGNCVDSCECPARSAGYNMEGWVEDVAAQYDIVASSRRETITGTMSEKSAKKCWLDAIDNLGNNRARIKGKEIAKELGWL